MSTTTKYFIFIIIFFMSIQTSWAGGGQSKKKQNTRKSSRSKSPEVAYFTKSKQNQPTQHLHKATTSTQHRSGKRDNTTISTNFLSDFSPDTIFPRLATKHELHNQFKQAADLQKTNLTSLINSNNTQGQSITLTTVIDYPDSNNADEFESVEVGYADQKSYSGDETDGPEIRKIEYETQDQYQYSKDDVLMLRSHFRGVYAYSAKRTEEEEKDLTKQVLENYIKERKRELAQQEDSNRYSLAQQDIRELEKVIYTKILDTGMTLRKDIKQIVQMLNLTVFDSIIDRNNPYPPLFQDLDDHKYVACLERIKAFALTPDHTPYDHKYGSFYRKLMSQLYKGVFHQQNPQQKKAFTKLFAMTLRLRAGLSIKEAPEVASRIPTHLKNRKNEIIVYQTRTQDEKEIKGLQTTIKTIHDEMKQELRKMDEFGDDMEKKHTLYEQRSAVYEKIQDIRTQMHNAKAVHRADNEFEETELENTLNKRLRDIAELNKKADAFTQKIQEISDKLRLICEESNNVHKPEKHAIHLHYILKLMCLGTPLSYQQKETIPFLKPILTALIQTAPNDIRVLLRSGLDLTLDPHFKFRFNTENIEMLETLKQASNQSNPAFEDLLSFVDTKANQTPEKACEDNLAELKAEREKDSGSKPQKKSILSRVLSFVKPKAKATTYEAYEDQSIVAEEDEDEDEDTETMTEPYVSIDSEDQTDSGSKPQKKSILSRIYSFFFG